MFDYSFQNESSKNLNSNGQKPTVHGIASKYNYEMVMQFLEKPLSITLVDLRVANIPVRFFIRRDLFNRAYHFQEGRLQRQSRYVSMLWNRHYDVIINDRSGVQHGFEVTFPSFKDVRFVS